MDWNIHSLNRIIFDRVRHDSDKLHRSGSEYLSSGIFLGGIHFEELQQALRHILIGVNESVGSL